MTIHRRTRRGLALAGGTALMTALTVLPVGPASAAPATGTLALSATVDQAGTCNATAAPPDQHSTLVDGEATDSIDLSATVSDPADLGDVSTVTGHVTSTGAAALSHGSISSFTISSTGQVSVVKDQGSGSSCDARGFLASFLTVAMPVATKGWLYVTHDQGPDQITQITVLGTSAGTPIVSIFGGPAVHATDRAFLTPDTYQGDFVTQFVGGGFSIGKVASAIAIKGRFVKAGAALSGAKGSGTAYVALPAATSCSKHTATLGWTGKAGQVKSASVLVNGTKQASVSSPRAGSSLVLKNLSATKDLKITANLLMKDGSKKSATRAYVPCRG